MKKIFRFLELEKAQVDCSKLENIGNYSTPILPKTKLFLEEYFSPHNAVLSNLIGEDFTWGY